MRAAFYAHSLAGRPPEDWEPLEDHLRQVADLGGKFASSFGATDWGNIAGLWHDLGKYSGEFQDYLLHENGVEAHLEQYAGRVDHSTAGAQHSVKSAGLAGRILAYCIAGHHAGLPDSQSVSGSSGLDQRLAANRAA
jgi:CRISPR-associated endonuclease/helicase Cas3